MNYLRARRMSYSIGFTLPVDTADLLKLIPDRAWAPAYDAEGKVRADAWVAELTGLLDLTEHKWPKDMRVNLSIRRSASTVQTMTPIPARLHASITPSWPSR